MSAEGESPRLPLGKFFAPGGHCLLLCAAIGQCSLTRRFHTWGDRGTLPWCFDKECVQAFQAIVEGLSEESKYHSRRDALQTMCQKDTVDPR